jgi:diketogulonate reductase-like aldo/keto reductase
LGADSPAHVAINIKALDLELSASEIELLDGLYRPRDILNDYVSNPMPRHLGGVRTGS